MCERSEHQNEPLVLSTVEVGGHLKELTWYSTDTMHMYSNKESMLKETGPVEAKRELCKHRRMEPRASLHSPLILSTAAIYTGLALPSLEKTLQQRYMIHVRLCVGDGRYAQIYDTCYQKLAK